MKTSHIAMIALCATLVITLTVRTNDAAVREAAAATEAPFLRGDMKVTLEVAAPNGDIRTEVEEACVQLDFHPEYIGIREKSGSGRIVPVRLIRSLRWQGR